MGREPRAEPALVGVPAGAVTLGVAETLAAALIRVAGGEGTPSPLLAVADSFVDLTPAWLRDAAISVFGSADKVALLVGMGVVLSALCAGIGVLAARRLLPALVAFALVGAVGTMAVLSRPGASVTDAAPTVLCVVGGLLVLRTLTRRQTQTEQPAPPAPDGATGRHSVEVEVE